MARTKFNANSYTHVSKKKEDKYAGLFNSKQLSDLNGGIDDIPVERISKAEMDRRKKQSKGAGINMHSPFGSGF